MGYLKTKLSIYFKDYNSLSQNNLLKITKETYNSNPSIVNESLKKCKTSKLKVILTILSIPVTLLTLCFLYLLIFIYGLGVNPNFFPNIGSEENYLLIIYIFIISLFTIFYLISRSNITIKKSNYLMILTIVATIICVITILVFIWVIIQVGSIDIQ